MAVNAKTWAPIATFVAVAAVGVTAALVHDGAGRSGPRTLRLATGDDSAPRSASSGGGSDYQLDVTLPADKPADQRAFGLGSGPADSDVVAALAKALQAGVPVREGDDWRAGGLFVTGKAGQAWSWSPCGGGPEAPISSDGATPCAVAVPGAGSSGSSGSGTVAPAPAGTQSPTPEPQPISEDVVRDAARDVLTAVGLDAESATIETSPYGGSATVDRPRTVGLTTRVDVDRDGHITSAAGWLGTAEPVDRYPVISAVDAFEELPALAHADICRIAPDGQGCLPPEPTVIVGAELGLSLQPLTDGGSMLVPSWLFAVKGGGTIPAIAVEKQYRTAHDGGDSPATGVPETGQAPTESKPDAPSPERQQQTPQPAVTRAP